MSLLWLYHGKERRASAVLSPRFVVFGILGNAYIVRENIS